MSDSRANHRLGGPGADPPEADDADPERGEACSSACSVDPRQAGERTRGHRSSWHVYILRCADDTLYTGITTDVERRLREHNGEGGNSRGAAYTRARRPVELVWQAPAADRRAASAREYRLKRLDRSAKQRLVAAAAGGQVDGLGVQ